ncbi:ABC transporter substrate-binding protein [Belliella pelovolcani]|uniref:ABC transporter substrate-binding protein n=1 Tax=Belliella pelovolcani TaxID=529505 RepID=UPI00391B9E96
MQNLKCVVYVLFLCISFSCKEKSQDQTQEETILENAYASGFMVIQGNGYKVLEVSKGFPGEHDAFKYLVIEDSSVQLPDRAFNAVISLGPSSIVMTSTSHIPHLDLLGESKKLKAFPNLDLISSPAVRELIEKGEVKDLGSGAQANVELIIDLQPDWVMISTLGGDLKHIELLKQAGVPAVINGEYVEQDPLGRAEWIKFTGALLGRYEEAVEIFNTIEAAYLEAKKLAESVSQEDKPKVMAGVMYKDIWYVPGSDSWGAQLLLAAGGDYIFKDQRGSGSAQLNYEYVLDQAQEADFWLGASDFPSLQSMRDADQRYTAFKAFELGNVYSYTSKKGSTGGIEYFELGYMRPDLILKDLINILHPSLLKDYKSYFYTRLNEE